MISHYQTHTLPHYVHVYFGRPLTMKRSGRTFTFTGKYRDVDIEADNAIAARDAIRRYVVAITGTTDGRIKLPPYHRVKPLKRRGRV